MTWVRTYMAWQGRGSREVHESWGGGRTDSAKLSSYFVGNPSPLTATFYAFLNSSRPEESIAAFSFIFREEMYILGKFSAKSCGAQWRGNYFQAGGAQLTFEKPRVPPNLVFSSGLGHLFFTFWPFRRLKQNKI